MSAVAESEAKPATLAVPAKKVDDKKRGSVSNDPERFKEGVIIKAKLIGFEHVKHGEGDEVCQTSMIKLKAVHAALKQSKRKLDVKISLEGIELIDLLTQESLHKHTVNNISYIARDVNDPRAIGYIYRNAPNDFEYFGLKTANQAQEMFNLLKQLFEVVLELRTKPAEEAKAETAEGGDAKKEGDATKTVPKPASQPNLLDDDAPLAAPAAAAPKDLFDLSESAAPVADASKKSTQPFFIDDKFDAFSSVVPPADPYNGAFGSSPPNLGLSFGQYADTVQTPPQFGQSPPPFGSSPPVGSPPQMAASPAPAATVPDIFAQFGGLNLSAPSPSGPASNPFASANPPRPAMNQLMGTQPPAVSRQSFPPQQFPPPQQQQFPPQQMYAAPFGQPQQFQQQFPPQQMFGQQQPPFLQQQPPFGQQPQLLQQPQQPLQSPSPKPNIPSSPFANSNPPFNWS